MDSNFTFALQRSTYAQLSMCVKFVLILALGSYHRNLRTLSNTRDLLVTVTSLWPNNKRPPRGGPSKEYIQESSSLALRRRRRRSDY